MSTNRQDAWSKEEDALLAEMVLNYIRDGRTQLEAFREVARRLSRTPAACGFRWNASVRKVYEDAVNQAKKDRKNLTVIGNATILDQSSDHRTLEATISLLEKMKGSFFQNEQSPQPDQEQYQTIVNENKGLKEKMLTYQTIIKKIEKLIVEAEDESS